MSTTSRLAPEWAVIPLLSRCSVVGDPPGTPGFQRGRGDRPLINSCKNSKNSEALATGRAAADAGFVNGRLADRSRSVIIRRLAIAPVLP